MVVRATTSTTATVPFGIVDVYSGAAVAFSLRKLSGAYTGAAVRVRRSNDNAEQDIGFDANGNFNESALTSFVGANSAFVTTWYDQSGNARNATQTTAANQPRIVNAGVVDKVNGMVSPTYNGTSTFLQNTTITVSQPDTMFLAAKTNNNTTSQNAIDGITARQAIFQGGGQSGTLQGRVSYFAGAVQSGADLWGLALVACTAFFNGANSKLFKNQLLTSSGNPGTNNLTGLRVGVFDPNAVNKAHWNGQIPEFILYPADQSANRAAIEANIMSYYGIN